MGSGIGVGALNKSISNTKTIIVGLALAVEMASQTCRGKCHVCLSMLTQCALFRKLSVGVGFRLKRRSEVAFELNDISS